jgi:hypothetical protein
MVAWLYIRYPITTLDNDTCGLVTEDHWHLSRAISINR